MRLRSIAVIAVVLSLLLGCSKSHEDGYLEQLRSVVSEEELSNADALAFANALCEYLHDAEDKTAARMNAIVATGSMGEPYTSKGALIVGAALQMCPKSDWGGPLGQ